MFKFTFDQPIVNPAQFDVQNKTCLHANGNDNLTSMCTHENV